jgi:hypothetical protein
MVNNKQWIGFDLDGTLAHYDGWMGPEHIGEPIPDMIEEAKRLIDLGITVKVVTARVSHVNELENSAAERAIQLWCQRYIGKALPVTCKKDFNMWLLYDDRAIAVEKNTGQILGGGPLP